VLALVDPKGESGEAEQVALEHGATVLAVELARLQSLAETEIRLGRDLVEELLAGLDDQRAIARAQALSYDLERPHRVVVVEVPGAARDDNTVFHAVRRAARDTGVGSLVIARAGTVVVLADADPSSDVFHAAVLGELGGASCRVGIGGVCQRPAEFPRSYHEAQLALKVQVASHSIATVTEFDRLGVYRILSGVEHVEGVERFVREWLGALLDYDVRGRSELVITLSVYLQCGGSYEATANALAVHKSTLKYRLQRIRQISGHDLSDADTAFNLQLATRAWQTLRALRA